MKLWWKWAGSKTNGGGIFELLAQVGQPEAVSPENQGPEIATTGRTEWDPALTPHQESTN